MTNAKREIIEDSRTPAAANIQHLIDSGALKGDLVRAEDTLDRLNLHSERYTRIQIGKALHELQFRKLDKTKLSDGCTVNLWAVREVHHWVSADHACRKAHYEAIRTARFGFACTPDLILEQPQFGVDPQVGGGALRH